MKQQKSGKESFREAFHSKPNVVSSQNPSILERLTDKIQSTFSKSSRNETRTNSRRPKKMIPAQNSLINTKNLPKGYDRVESLGHLSASSSFSSDKSKKSSSMGRY
ncbi:MAG: hypothetical protein MK137_00630 [Rickettsiales bacterium]|nr:hypothetical protein [Rickettsiales bacterium]